ncbi:MAG: hypothetical protein ISR72_01910 [Methylobacter sp.]|nr:hypothetical protein [Methylobacter sp.]
MPANIAKHQPRHAQLRELIMGILMHSAEVEVKSPQFLLDGVREQIESMQKIYKK